jgi:phosphatidylglycerol lysyltransferase
MQSDYEIARKCVLTEGWNSTCYQALNPGIDRWLSTSRPGLVGYVRALNHFVVAGAPICAPQDLSSILTEWLEFASESKGTVFFGAERRLYEELSQRPRFCAVAMGGQPLWTPESFRDSVEKHPSLRAQLARAIHKGVSVSEATLIDATLLDQLRTLLDRWLATRGLPPLHFLVEPNTLVELRDRKFYVARLNDRVVGLLTLCPIPTRKGWLTEQFVRDPEAPNGTIELLLHHAASDLATQDLYRDGLFTMGMVPLSAQSETLGFGDPPPGWFELLKRWSRAHGRRFYNFGGLEAFKNKFQPDSWEPIWAITNQRNLTYPALRSVAQAFTVEVPELAIARGLLRAIRIETQRILRP